MSRYTDELWEYFKYVTLTGVLLALAFYALLAFTGCANLPQRTYSITYTDEEGRSIGGGVTLGDTRGYAK